MDFKRFFYKTIEKDLEKINENDRALLAEVGIEEYPFFKFTKGENSVVVYGYERRQKRFVVRFKSPDDPPYNKTAADFLKKNKFRVAKILGGADISDRKLTYEKTPGKPKLQIGGYDTAEWVGYDFGIQAKAAVCLLEKYDYNTTNKGWDAFCVLERIGIESGKLFGGLYKIGRLYLDFHEHNLAGDSEACLFDFHNECLKPTQNIGYYLEVCSSFLEYADWYPENRGHKIIVKSRLIKSFVNGLVLSETAPALINGVRRNFAGLG